MQNQGVIACSKNELLTSSLKKMKNALVFCKNRYTKYLARKRGVFPEFQQLKDIQMAYRL